MRRGRKGVKFLISIGRTDGSSRAEPRDASITIVGLTAVRARHTGQMARVNSNLYASRGENIFDKLYTMVSIYSIQIVKVVGRPIIVKMCFRDNPTFFEAVRRLIERTGERASEGRNSPMFT